MNQKVKVIIYKRLKMICERLDWNNKDDIIRLAQLLQQGKVAIGTSDTVIGLLALCSKEGFEKLNKIKGRSEKPYLVLIPSIDYVKKFSYRIENNLTTLMQNAWPGPLTLILKAQEILPSFMKSKNNTIALRIPDHQGLQKLLSIVGPLFSTSANKTTKPVPITLDQIDPEILSAVNVIISDHQPPKALPSTILDCSDEDIRIIREGAYSIKDLKTILGNDLK
ncbi:MAG: L-threonylcarbamoyladenylate synthase [Candidatus Babeliales bacterium]